MKEDVRCERRGHLRAAAHPGRPVRRGPARRAGAELAATVVGRGPGPHRGPARRGRRRGARPGLPERRGAGDRPGGRSRRRPARQRARLPARPAVWLGPAGGHQRRHAGPDRGQRPRPGRRRRVNEPGRVLHDRHALGGSGGERRPLRPAGPGSGDGRRGSTTRCPAGCSKPPRTCAASTRSTARSRTSWPCAPTNGRWPPRSEGRFKDEIVPVTSRPEGRHRRRHRRAPPGRHHARGAGRRCARCGCRRTPRPR